MSLLSAVVLAAGCSGCSGGSGKDGRKEGISRMNIRPERKGEALLGPRHQGTGGKYSICPPRGWTVGRARPAGLGGESLEAAPAAGSGRFLSLAKLEAERKALDESLRKDSEATLLGTDLFIFREFYVIQSLVRRGNWVSLRLKLFAPSGKALQLAYRVRAERYRGEARAIEASIASVEFKD